MRDPQRFVVIPTRRPKDDLHIAIRSVEWGVRKIRPSHSSHLTGRFPLGRGRGSVQFESGKERDVMGWLTDYNGMRDLKSQPVTVQAWVNEEKLTYTTDIYVEYDPVPASLADLGFGHKTLIEVKPLKYCDDERLHMKLYVMQLATGLPVLLISEIEGGTNV